MDLQDLIPVVVYDNNCYLCIKFAKAVNLFAGGKIRLVGHYTDLGKKIRDSFLDSSALDMFWFIDGKTAYGGRAALAPLIKEIVLGGQKEHQTTYDFDGCDIHCKTAGAVFVRSASLFTHSKTIPLKTKI
jgi:predicted DCC family thiol-disulfide oxidoreductase YuxK